MDNWRRPTLREDTIQRILLIHDGRRDIPLKDIYDAERQIFRQAPDKDTYLKLISQICAELRSQNPNIKQKYAHHTSPSNLQLNENFPGSADRWGTQQFSEQFVRDFQPPIGHGRTSVNYDDSLRDERNVTARDTRSVRTTSNIGWNEFRGRNDERQQVPSVDRQVSASGQSSVQLWSRSDMGQSSKYFDDREVYNTGVNREDEGLYNFEMNRDQFLNSLGRFQSPPRRRSPGPLRRPPPGPLRHLSPGPSRRHSPGPIRRPSPGPIRRPSPGPIRRPSPGPIRRPSPERVTRRSPEAIRRRSPSPFRRRSRSPLRRRSRSPLTGRSRSPRRRRLPSPKPSLRQRSPIESRRRGPSPQRRRSPNYASSSTRGSEKSLNTGDLREHLRGKNSNKTNGSVKEQTGSKSGAEDKGKGRSDLDIGIVHTNYPANKLTREELELLQNAVMNAIQEIPEDGPQVRFLHCTFGTGILLIKCADNVTLEWIKQSVSLLKPWEGVQLKIITGSSLPNPQIFTALIPNDAKEVELPEDVVLTRLKKMNRTFKIEYWAVLSKTRKKGSVLYKFSIDEESAKSLATMNYNAYYGFGQVEFRKA